MKPCWVLLAAAIVCLSGCFLFDNPYDGPTPSASFQIVVNSATYGGTYVWNSTDGAFEATVNGIQYFIFQSSGSWCLSTSLAKGPENGGIAHSLTPYAALPPTNVSTGWTPPAVITAIDNSTGGVTGQAAGPDGPVAYGDLLQVGFSKTAPDGLATYQWERSSLVNFTSRQVVGTDSTYQTSTFDYGQWLRVIVTPLDSTGTVKGIAIASAPVRVN